MSFATMQTRPRRVTLNAAELEFEVGDNDVFKGEVHY
jgi:hypothetical protein